MKRVLKHISAMVSNLFNRYRITKNIYGTKYNRRVLISYTTTPFSKNKNNNLHTNNKELLIIVEILHSMNYIIDVIEYNVKLNLNFGKYDLIFGFGESFENSFYDITFIGKRVYYATGAHVYWQNSAEIDRIIAFNNRKKSNLIPKRIVPWNWSMSTTMSDAIIMIGNSWTASTYKAYSDTQIHEINATGAFQKFPVNPIRDIDKTRKSFLWFGSTGLIHKGLDVCLDFFSRHREMQLHICGPLEIDFFIVYEKELQLENIHYHGFINTESNLFQQIVIQCLFSIMPSCSEGQSTALLTTMGTGLIPIATRQTGIDVDKYGFLLEEISTDAILKIVNRINDISDMELLDMSSFTFNDIHLKHSLDAFKESFKLLINKIILE